MNQTAKPYNTRGMVEVMRTRANFGDIFLGRYIAGNMTGWLGSRRAVLLMRVLALRFSSGCTLPMSSNLREVARTLVNSRELFKDKNQWKQRPSPTKHEEWSKSRELARTITPFFVAGVSPTQRSQLILSGICPKRDAAMFWCRVLKFQNWPIRQLYNGQGTQWPFLKFERPTPA